MFASKDLFFTKPSGGYQISRSVRFRSSATAYFNRTLTTPTNNQKWTFSAWIKRGQIGVTYAPIFAGGASGSAYAAIWFHNDVIELFSYSGTTQYLLVTTQVFRDPSAWYHIVASIDTTQATASNRVKLYINGVQVTAFSTATYPTQNYSDYIDSAVAHYLGQFTPALGAYYYDGYMTEINFVDGQGLTPSSFGSTDAKTGVWQPIKYTGTYGTNGFYLNFSDNSAATAAAIGKDYSGNGNNWTPNNISVTAGATYDSMLDVPTNYADGGNGRGNYCVINPLQNGGTLTNGNLNLVGNSGSATGTIAVTSGKWYWEVTDTTMGTGAYIGVSDDTWFGTGSSWSYSQVWVYIGTGLKGGNGSTASYGASYTTGDVIGIALDMDGGTITFYKNNTSQGTAFNTGISGKVLRPFLGTASASNTTYDANFGQRPFTYTPPSGFVALNTQNLPTPTISNGANYMNAVLYTGDGSATTRTVTGASFQADLVWIKDRTAADDHSLTDSVRGFGTGKSMNSDTTYAETDAVQTYYGYTSSVNSTGFVVGKGSDPTNGNRWVNQSTYAYVAWLWKKTPSAGFDIVACTTNGSGILTATSHNLGVVPSMVILKARTGADSWYVYHKNATTTPTQATLILNATSAVNTVNGSSGGVDKWTLTTTTFAAGNAAWTYQANTNHIAYLFAEVAGYSKFGSYTGNGSTDGPFVYCGFRPRFILIKSTSSGTASWFMYDTSRSTYNAATLALQANASDAELTGRDIDILSNGFKCRSSDANFNANAGTYIFMAVAENPFKNSLAR